MELSMEFLVAAAMAIGAEIGTAVHEKNLVDFDKTELVMGIDENKNGLRDDFERMLIARVSDDKARNMLFHVQSYAEKAIEFGSTKTIEDTADAAALADQYAVNKVFKCLSRQDQNMFNYILKNVPNTQDRIVATNNFNAAFKKSKYKFKNEKFDCDAFTAGLPDYVSTQMTLK